MSCCIASKLFCVNLTLSFFAVGLGTRFGLPYCLGNGGSSTLGSFLIGGVEFPSLLSCYNVLRLVSLRSMYGWELDLLVRVVSMEATHPDFSGDGNAQGFWSWNRRMSLFPQHTGSAYIVIESLLYPMKQTIVSGSACSASQAHGLVSYPSSQLMAN
jgi:hypothetical protein